MSGCYWLRVGGGFGGVWKEQKQIKRGNGCGFETTFGFGFFFEVLLHLQYFCIIYYLLLEIMKE